MGEWSWSSSAKKIRVCLSSRCTRCRCRMCEPNSNRLVSNSSGRWNFFPGNTSSSSRSEFISAPNRNRRRIRGNDYAMNRRRFLGTLSAAALLERATYAQVREGYITDVDGIKVGHFTETRRPTGCTVVLYERGAVAGVDVRGSAPGTRETDLLKPTNLVDRVNAIVLSGGSAFGLDTATGVMRYLEEHDAGYVTAAGKVPIVPAAILYDLNVGDAKIRPNADAGYKACTAAKSGP